MARAVLPAGINSRAIGIALAAVGAIGFTQVHPR